MINEGDLNKEKCKLQMQDIPVPYLVINIDKYFEINSESTISTGGDDSRCDYLFVGYGQHNSEQCYVAPIELKSGELRSKKIIRQLQSGSHFIQEYVSAQEDVDLCPIAVVGRIAPKEKGKLRAKNSRIKFHSQKKTVRVINCGEKLTKGLTNVP